MVLDKKVTYNLSYRGIRSIFQIVITGFCRGFGYYFYTIVPFSDKLKETPRM